MAAAVLVHGTPLDHRAWDPLIGELAGTHCVAHDLPGHGSRADEALPDDYAALADDLARALDGDGVERAHVVGHSFGGQVAATFAVRHPARTASVAIDAGGLPAIAEAAIGRWFTPAAVERDDPGVRYARECLAAAHPATLAAAFRLIAAYDGVQELAASGAPVHIVAAERDVVGEPGGLRAAAAAIPGARCSTRPAPPSTTSRRFHDREAMQRWHESAQRAALHRELDGVAERVGAPERLSGLEPWFVAVCRPPRWKMWLASFVGAYPLAVLFQWLVAVHVETLPLLVRSAVLPLVLLSLMTYVMMPVVTRVLASWLEP